MKNEMELLRSSFGQSDMTADPYILMNQQKEEQSYPGMELHL